MSFRICQAERRHLRAFLNHKYLMSRKQRPDRTRAKVCDYRKSANPADSRSVCIFSLMCVTPTNQIVFPDERDAKPKTMSRPTPFRIPGRDTISTASIPSVAYQHLCSHHGHLRWTLVRAGERNLVPEVDAGVFKQEKVHVVEEIVSHSLFREDQR